VLSLEGPAFRTLQPEGVRYFLEGGISGNVPLTPVASTSRVG